MSPILLLLQEQMNFINNKTIYERRVILILYFSSKLIKN